jgi:serine O-acetyltransferase
MFFKRLQEDIDAFLARDPAARSRLEVILCYPGFHALLFHRVSRGAWRHGWRLLGRFISHIGKILTGIEIHPAAQIGRRFVIDHGTGVVVGETSIIGDDVTLYHAVTLGGIAPSVDSGSQVDQKRHPTIEDGAIIGSGAQVLGPITIGKGARIGANAVVTRDLPAGVTAVGIPARVIMPRDKDKAKKFVAYGTPTGGVPDPVTRMIDSLRSQVTTLMERVDELEGRLPEGEAPDHEKTAGSEGDGVEKIPSAAASGRKP